MKLEVVEDPVTGVPQVALLVDEFYVFDPNRSTCGRFTVDPLTEYGIDPRAADALIRLNRLLQDEPATGKSEAAGNVPLLEYITRLEASEDSAGCDPSLTVVSRQAARQLFDEARALTGNPPIATQRLYLQKGGNTCPQCGGCEIIGHAVEVAGLQAVQEVTCNDCGAAWEDNYRFVGYTLTDEGIGNNG